MTKAIIVGAGMGGLSAAIDLARQGVAVTVLERASAPGGKMRQVGPGRIDGGPTVFTMRWVFDSLFDAAGTSLGDHLTLHPATTLARHAWGSDRLDLFADIDRSAAAIDSFCGEGRGFRAFCTEARRIYRTLEGPFIRAARPTAMGLAMGAGIGPMLGVRPFDTMWTALGRHFRDPRLRQLFGRYATYCGSSPFRAPATLMLVAHVEQEGVWLVEGGMHQVAVAMAALLTRLGGTIRYDAEVSAIRPGAVQVDGAWLPAEAIVWNGDPSALARLTGAVAATPPAERSYSAVTWAMQAEASGFPLLHHSVFFSPDYRAEFDALRTGVPDAPTVYICAQDRDDTGAGPEGTERLLVLINAPPHGDTHDVSEDRCLLQTTRLLSRSGLTLHPTSSVTTTPAGFHRLFPGTGGALYGPAVHGAMASFKRPGSRTKMPGLYLAGGATHPGAGVPMAALSGRLAAASVMADLNSNSRSRPVAMRGGTSMR